MMGLVFELYLWGCLAATCFNVVYYIFYYDSNANKKVYKFIELVVSTFIISIFSWLGLFVVLISMAVVLENEKKRNEDVLI